MTDATSTPHEALAGFLDALSNPDVADQSGVLRAAHHVGEASAATDLTIEETFELLESEASDILTDLSAVLLGSIVRGYVDQVVRTRGLTRSRGTGRLSSHVQRLAALHRINRVATASLRLDAMLSTVVEVVAETVAGDACSVFLSDEHSERLILRATTGLNPEAIGRLAIRTDAGITGLAATTRMTQAAVDARSHPAFFTYPIVGEDVYVSQVSIPLVLREPERLVGVMNIQSIAAREFDQDEITFLETAAGELSIAIENARLYSQTDDALRQRIADLRALQSVTRSIVSTLRSDELLPLIAEQAVLVARGDASSICRVRQGNAGLVVQPIANYPDGDDISLDCVPVSFIEAVWRSRSAMVLAASHEDPEGSAIIGAPMTTAHGALGAICVRVQASESMAEEQLGLVQAFADSAALAIENAELYDEARRGYATASTLLQEMHHRVRNNLQTVAALLSMQARHADSSEAAAPLQEAVARVQSIAAVHSLLSSENVTSASVTAIVKHVVEEASATVVPPGLRLRYSIEPSDVEASSRQATILALLVNECVTNAIEHGMVGRADGHIAISASEREGQVEVIIEDDGRGLPEGFDVARDSELGLRIARALATSDLRGSFALEPRAEGGARSIIRFPLHQ